MREPPFCRWASLSETHWIVPPCWTCLQFSFDWTLPLSRHWSAIFMIRSSAETVILSFDYFLLATKILLDRSSTSCANKWTDSIVTPSTTLSKVNHHHSLSCLSQPRISKWTSVVDNVPADRISISSLGNPSSPTVSSFPWTRSLLLIVVNRIWWHWINRHSTNSISRSTLMPILSMISFHSSVIYLFLVHKASACRRRLCSTCPNQPINWHEPRWSYSLLFSRLEHPISFLYIGSSIGESPRTDRRFAFHGPRHHLRRCASSRSFTPSMHEQCSHRQSLDNGSDESESLWSLKAIDGSLQQRMDALDRDWARANELPADYDTDLELEWANLSETRRHLQTLIGTRASDLDLFLNRPNSSWADIQNNRNRYYHQRTANELHAQAKETMALLTSALSVHLNLGQHLIIDTAEVFVSLEMASFESLFNKQIERVQISLPSNFISPRNNETIVTLRVRSLFFVFVTNMFLVGSPTCLVCH